MAADLQRKDRYRSLLHSVADPAIAERLISQPTSLQGEQKIVSMLFCDVRGFTALSEQLPPAQVVAMINQHMTALTRVAYQFQGTVDKFVGDMIMVLFGAPESTPDHAQLAVECARAMQTARKEMNQQNTTSPALEIGIGIATGLVTAGCMGSEQRLSYTVLGHNVNLASRLCQLAGAGQIIIDHQTRSQLTDPSPFPIQPMPAQPLKGISEIIPLYQIK
jgi:class 3 adenylate cyclase